jgi:hypothetical protein
MMAKRQEDLEKVTLNLYRGDYGRLQEVFPETGAAVVVRRLVRNFIRNRLDVGDLALDVDIREPSAR